MVFVTFQRFGFDAFLHLVELLQPVVSFVHPLFIEFHPRLTTFHQNAIQDLAGLHWLTPTLNLISEYHPTEKSHRHVAIPSF